MPNEFPAQPDLAENFPAEEPVWVCPDTGWRVPKDPDTNLRWRARLLELAEEDKDLQQDLYEVCAKSVIFYVNFAVFTYRLFEPGPNGTVQQATNRHIPMVTWPIQDKHLLRLTQAIDEGHDLLTDKSRDMGATWNHIAVYAHRFLFKKSETHLMISRKEDAVDQLDGVPKNYPYGPVADPGTLFGKLDYVFRWTPEWMMPKCARKKMHLVNLETGTRVDGESANATAGSSDRRTSILLDEMAKMKEGESIKRSTADVTACRLPCSTPNGPGTSYSKWRMSGQIPVFILPWWEHPEKGKGRYTEYDATTEKWKIKSPWYDAEEGKRTPREMAIEIDMDHVGSGDTIFDASAIEAHRLVYAQRAPHVIMSIGFPEDIADSKISAILQEQNTRKLKARPAPKKGNVKVWTRLQQGRLDQTKDYVVACDISMGVGASNSTISVMCQQTREKVVSVADANIPPFKFARLVAALCLWVGGSRGMPTLIWENNGAPGVDFGNQIVKTFQYPYVYFDTVGDGTTTKKQGKRYGWRSNPDKKAAALGELARCYSHGGFINHDPMALDEALTYITFPDGSIGPAELLEESASARKAHGDRVIADMLCLEATGLRATKSHKAPQGPLNTFGGRLRRHQQRIKRRRRNADKRFNF